MRNGMTFRARPWGGIWLAAGVGALLAATVVFAALPATGQPFVNWPAYEMGADHTSYNAAATTITAANAASLTEVGGFVPPGNLGSVLISSPVVYDGVIYVGSQNGTFYAIDENTDTVLWSQYTTQLPLLTCSTRDAARGFAATPTVAPDPTTGLPTVYEAAPDGYLYAWDAATGTQLWRSVIAIPSTKKNNYFDWSSPTVSNGVIYVGVASACSNPYVHGGLNAYDQATGALLGKFDADPLHSGSEGPGIWSSALMTDDGNLYVSTGSAIGKKAPESDEESIIQLDPATLTPLDSWQIPRKQVSYNSDFGSSPVQWTADVDGVPTEMVGACDKNGYFYALQSQDLSAGPVWSDLFSYSSNGIHCLASAVWDSDTGQLFISGTKTKIDKVHYAGSVQEVDPATGAPIWQTGLPAPVLGTPTLDGAGVLAVATCSFTGPNAVYLLDASNGQILATYNLNTLQENEPFAPIFAQPVFADGYLIVATAGQGLVVFAPSS